MWKRTKREDNSIIPLAERDVRPIVYYLNTTFPDDLKATAVKIGHNWDDVFMEAAMAATGKTEAELREQLRGDADENAVFVAGDDRNTGALFQIRENQCSFAGVEAYLARNPSLQDVVDSATRYAGLLPGNLEKGHVRAP